MPNDRRRSDEAGERNERFNETRPISLTVFHHDGDKLTVFKVPPKVKTLQDVRDFYGRNLLSKLWPGDRIYVRLKDMDAPDCLPPALCRFNDYEVFLKEIGQALSFCSRFRDFLALEEIKARTRVWEEVLDVVGLIKAEIKKGVTQERDKLNMDALRGRSAHK